MSCPCGLTKDEVLDLDRRDRVPLVGGKCQSPLASGEEGVCGKALGAHPLAASRTDSTSVCIPDPVPDDSVPPYRHCVFVLCRFLPCGSGYRAVGTAVAVHSSQKNILLTAGHCVARASAKYFCVSIIHYPYVFDSIPTSSFEVDVVASSIDSPDFAILRRCQGEFEDAPTLMPISELPWHHNPRGWGGSVFVYHVPLEVIDHAVNDEAGSPDMVGEVDTTDIRMQTRHHFRLKAFQRGSSGGAVISRSGKVIGILAKSQTYGTLSMDGVHINSYNVHAAGNGQSPTSHEMLEDKEGEREECCSISAASTIFPETGSTAVIPASVNLHFHYQQTSHVISLGDFLQEGESDAKPREVLLELALKEGRA